MTYLLDSSVIELFQIQMRISFLFLRAKDLHTSLLIMKTCSFFNYLVCRRYIRKVSVHLVQKHSVRLLF